MTRSRATRFSLAISLAATLAAGYLVSMGLGELLLDDLAAGVDLAQAGGPPVDETALEPVGPTTPAPASAPTRDDLLAGNLFDMLPELPATTPRVETAGADAGTPAAPAGGEAPEATSIGLCELPLRLVAVVAADAGRAGLATVEESGVAREVRVGEALAGGLVTRITWNRVYLRREGSAECFLDLRQQAGAKAVPAASEPAAATAPPAAPPEDPREARLAAAGTDSIQVLSDTERVVGRDLLRSLADNEAVLTRQAHVAPVEDGGRIVGFRLSGIAAGSLAEQLGLRNGDVVKSVNGVPLVGIREAMRAWEVSRLADRFEIGLVRRGNGMTFVYHVR